jgi:hypothetical protein
VISNLDPEVDHVMFARASFDQAMVNLVVNARDAMPEGGSLTITTRDAVLGEAELRQGAPRAGAHVAVHVSDTGQGIRPEHIPQLFDPFFTTKSAGNGTGLGLTTVYAFMRNSGGHIDVTSTVGQGTTISLFFPVVDAHSPAFTDHPLRAGEVPATVPSAISATERSAASILSLRDPPLGATLSARELEAPSLRAGGDARRPFGPLR